MSSSSSSSSKLSCLTSLFKNLYINAGIFKDEYAGTATVSHGHLLDALKEEYPECSKCRTASGCMDRILTERLAAEVNTMTATQAEQLFKYIWATYSIFVPNLLTLRQKTSVIHKLLDHSSKEMRDLCYRIIRMTDAMTEIVNTKAKKAQSEGNEHTKIYSLKHVMRILDETRESGELYDLLTFLLLSTGRRFIEVITSKFEPGEDDSSLYVSNLAKKGKDDENMKYLIPVIPRKSASIVLDRIKCLRDLTEGLVQSASSKIVITNKLNHNCNVFLTRIFKQDTTTHTCRKIYACIAFMLYGREDESYNSFIERALCHKSIDTSLYYTTVRVVP